MRPDPRYRTDAARRPVRTDTDVTAAGGVALVSATLRNDTGADLRVRVENDLDGPVLPPRQEGLPAAGWDDDGYTGRVPAGGRLGVGYACPISVPAGDADPVSVELCGPADDADAPTSDVAGVVRSLGRAVPPADAVPTDSAVGLDGTRLRPERSDRTADVAADVPQSVAAWLDAVERRVRRAERLVDATADEAAATLDDCGGVDGVAGLSDDLDADADALRAVSERVDDLAGRAAAADPEPVVSALLAAAEGTTEPAGRASESGDTTAEAGGRE